jgi:hypothetical protein
LRFTATTDLLERTVPLLITLPVTVTVLDETVTRVNVGGGGLMTTFPDDELMVHVLPTTVQVWAYAEPAAVSKATIEVVARRCRQSRVSSGRTAPNLTCAAAR